MPKDIAPDRFSFADDGTIPNNRRLRVLLYRGAVDAEDRARVFEQLFARNGWTNSWRDGLYDYHHFHSTAHEVLGIAEGSVTARLGGEQGASVALNAGDVVVLPAGTGHKRERASDDLLIVGAYAEGRDWDLCRGVAEDKEKVRRNIEALPDPERDPVTGVLKLNRRPAGTKVVRCRLPRRSP